MMKNGIIIATPSGKVASIMQDLLLLEGQDDDVVEEEFCWTDNEKDLRLIIKQSAPRLVFIEHCFDQPETKDVIIRLCDRYDDLHIAVFSVGVCTPLAAARLINLGAESYLDVHGDEGEFRHDAGVILRGKKYVPDEVEDLQADMKCLPDEGKAFTKQQLKVFHFTLLCLKKKEIADKLGLSVNTIKTHRQHIDRICGGSRKIDYLQYGLRKGILSADGLAEYEE
jgi:DNA-binding NarL/FixJ family response regulator